MPEHDRAWEIAHEAMSFTYEPGFERNAAETSLVYEIRAYGEAMVRESLLRSTTSKWNCPRHREAAFAKIRKLETERECLRARIKELEGPACDFARQLAKSLYRDINEAPSIETAAEWEAAVADRIRVAVSERLRELQDRMWLPDRMWAAWTAQNLDWGPDEHRTVQWAMTWLRGEVGR
jgi:hypothetical protein